MGLALAKRLAGSSVGCSALLGLLGKAVADIFKKLSHILETQEVL